LTVVLSPLDKKYVYQGITIFIYLGVANFIGGGNKEYYLCVQVCIKQEYYLCVQVCIKQEYYLCVQVCIKQEYYLCVQVCIKQRVLPMCTGMY
jgi:hypothetical protein